MSAALEQAFEHLGRIREHLTGLATLAAELADDRLSESTRFALRANTAALLRVNDLLHQPVIDRSPGSDLDGQSAGAAEGG